ncbi:hypothetical protein METP3_03793 [Methanosarcinales archaeon]|nr:hypothetical protein METP3_03793 [Methanosarcinales archaeon]
MKDNKIDKIPLVRKEIVNAVSNENLAIFIGAGVSRIIGCMGWDQLAQNLVNRCFLTKRKDGSSCINFKEKDTLSRYNDHKKTITICHHILKQNDFEDIFYDELKKSLEADQELLKSQNIYSEIIGLHGLNITTNADQHFDGKFNPPQIVYKHEDFKPSNIDRTKLYHIHGSILEKKSLIFTVSEYIQRYNNHPQQENLFKDFLEEIFRNYVVLFVGYGMAEFELLDFLITKFDPNKGEKLKHFILLPFYKGEENILEFEQYYYNSMGISVVGYEIDERGYGQLYEVIKRWNSEINQTSAYLYDSYQEIEDAANIYNKERADRIFQIIKNDKPQENYFFKKLASSNNPFPWLKPLIEKEYFNPRSIILNWNILGYLENVAIQNATKPSDEITGLLLDIINSISNYRNETSERSENYRTDWFMIKIIFLLPIEKITKEHIEFIGTALKSKWNKTIVSAEISRLILPKLTDNEAIELILKLMDVILGYQKINEETTDKYISVMDEHWLNEVLKNYTEAIAELCGIEAADIALNKIIAITNEDKFQFWIPAIEDHIQTGFPEQYECQLVHFVRDIFELSKPDQIKEKIKDLLIKEHPIFKRIVLHIINYHYKYLNELFWNWKSNPLDEVTLKHELYELLKANCSSFSKEQIKKVLVWIESKTYYISNETKDNEEISEKKLAYRKKEWLSALLETKDPDVISSFEKYQEINPAELDHPGFDTWIESWTGTISPIENVELLNKSNEDIVEYINNYKEEEEGWKKPSKEGLSESLRNCVSENPEKFANDMMPFLRVQRLYQHALLWGLSEAWRAMKDFPWESILNFMSRIVESDDFWSENYREGSYNYRNWIISQIADLIGDGIKNDKHAFDAKLLPQAEKILLLLAEKTESDLSLMNDLVTSVLNSSKGKIFSAIVNYSFRYAQLLKSDQEERWIEAIKGDFDKRLDRKIEPSLEFSVILGEYLKYLFYLDKKWVINNINRIFLKDDDIHWKASFTGYLFYSSTVHKDIYFLLRENGHYIKALQTEFSDVHITERLVQHICIGYIEDWEKLDDSASLIFKIITNRNINHLSAIVSYFGMLPDKLTDKIKTKIKPIWKVLFELLMQSEGNLEYQKTISNLSKWLSLIDEIDEQILEWLKLSAKYIEADFNTDFFVESLLKHAAKTPEKVGEIYLEMLNEGTYPYNEIENIQEIVRILYDHGQKESADRICNLYGAKDFDFLKTIFENHKNEDS